MINGTDAIKTVGGSHSLTVQSRCDDNEQLVVSVEDTGIEFPQDQADQIFNAFFTTREHGTGMGVTISRTIIEAHGGYLWSTDNHPCGAGFYFILASTRTSLAPVSLGSTQSQRRFLSINR
jgi:signal transduction histidine kinase